MMFFFCKQKTAYEFRISDWSSDVCSSDLAASARHRSAASMSRSAGSRQKSRSRAACTREPRVAATDGGSGRRSMAENRKDSAQLVNDDTFEGEKLGRAACRERVC